MANLRVGQGFDVHPFAPERNLVLGGVRIDHPVGLAGHSDADVLAHAIGDALLGAAALGDLGTHFPDSDPQFKNIDSLELLRRIVALMREKDWAIVNVDATVIAEAPRLAPYVSAMRDALAEALGIEPDCVSVKATTTEKLGFTGRGEGIAAMATALIEK